MGTMLPSNGSVPHLMSCLQLQTYVYVNCQSSWLTPFQRESEDKVVGGTGVGRFWEGLLFKGICVWSIW